MITEAVVWGSSELLNECNMAPFIGNETAVALIDSMQLVQSDMSHRGVMQFDKIIVLEGRCTQYDTSGLYLVCPQGNISLL